eukprot:4252240-Amphidinium_carterae.1
MRAKKQKSRVMEHERWLPLQYNTCWHVCCCASLQRITVLSKLSRSEVDGKELLQTEEGKSVDHQSETVYRSIVPKREDDLSV